MTDTSSRRRRAGLALILLAGTSLGGFGFWAGDKAHADDAAPAIVAPAVAPATAGFADLVEKVRPAVVTITTTEPAKQDENSPFPFMAPQRRGVMHALGSGFIIDSDGHIVTNNHVVDGATSVKVTLDDGRELDAKVIGRDPRTDVALIQVKSDKPLPFLSLGDSNKPRPGDWVVAVGNPFGLGGTVTAGVLSARGRDIGQGPYDDFLQIDAPINRGNSGGPLFGSDGKVIGVNTAIFSPSGGSVGIGFAIPSNLAKQVVAQLKDYGKTRRGWLGVRIQAVTPEIAESLGLPNHKGALVASVTPDGPAAKGGIQAGDVVTKFDGKEIDEMRRLPRVVAETAIDKAVPVEVWRKGKIQNVQIKVGELEAAEEQGLLAANPDEKQQPKDKAPAQKPTESLGMKLTAITPELRQQFEIKPDLKGVVITEVAGNSTASEKGLRPGDVIIEVGQEEVRKPEDVAAKVQKAKEQSKKSVLLLVDRKGDLRFVAIPLS